VVWARSRSQERCKLKVEAAIRPKAIAVYILGKTHRRSLPVKMWELSTLRLGVERQSREDQGAERGEVRGRV
jgi:hypothetical protein